MKSLIISKKNHLFVREPYFVMGIAEPSLVKTEAIYFFEEFCIQPIKLNVSFMRVEKLSNESGSKER
jgi:vacuolar protein sorting-associated protein 13A/C